MEAVIRSERCNDAFLDQFRRLSADISRQPILVGVEGLIGSGKTTFAETLQSECGAGSQLLSTDSYILVRRCEWRQRLAAGGIDLATWYDLDKVASTLAQVRAGGQFAVEGLYNVANGKHDLRKEFDVRQCPVFIVEGLFALHERIRSLLDITIFLGTEADIAVQRAAERDAVVRNIDADTFAIKRRIYHDGYLPYAEQHRAAADLLA